MSARSLEYSTVYKINRSDFLEVLKNNSLDFEKFCEIKDEVLNNHNFGIL